MKRLIGLIIIYIICFAIIIAGVFCGILLYKEITAKSYVNGSIDVSNKFSQKSFEYYSSNGVVFNYDKDDTYIFEVNSVKTEDFDGKNKDYIITLNSYVLFNVDINFGSVFSTVDIDFYDTNGNVAQSVEMCISVKFLSDKTQLTLSTKGAVNAKFLEQYFTDYGINLEIKEVLK